MSGEGPCPCGQDLGNNCAHYLTDYLIKKGNMKKNPPGCYCCDAGRPIRAKEVRSNVYQGLFGYSKHSTYKPSGCFIYCERNSDGQGHVYYGTPESASLGHTWGGADRYEFYY